jgi:hypothetical protein
MNCAIEADPELAQSLEGRTKRYGASLEAIIDN